MIALAPDRLESCPVSGTGRCGGCGLRDHADIDEAALLAGLDDVDRPAARSVLPYVYDELREAARRHLATERPGHTLQPTALVNEVWMRLSGHPELNPNDRKHFLMLASRIMRHVLVDHARRRNAAKRGGASGRSRVELDDVAGIEPGVVELDDVLVRLAEMDADSARIVELRFFGGLGWDEVAEITGLSRATVHRRWTTIRAWLSVELSETEP